MKRSDPNWLKQVSQRQFERDGHKAAETVFDYDGNGGSRVRQRLMILMRDSDTAFYVIGQTRQTEFAKLNPAALEPIFTSINFNK